ncbi:MAG: hypothetical protein M3Z65_02685 [Chloroflexota bacterium]|nr:hypothetical protein [Chloroflexota bacterium]
MSIAELEARIAALPAEPRAAAARIYAVSTTVGTLVAPIEMRPWIEKLFGSVEAVTSQRIVRVTDRVTLDGALFNDLRAKRPMSVPEKSGMEVAETIRSSENDPFCHPETGTPADDFGRITGRLGQTASNVAKYDGYHGVLVFSAHDPLAAMDEAAIADHFATARRWAEAAFERDPAAPYYFLMWNCLWRAGGSIVHGHMQMTTTRGLHYPKVERLRQAALAYRAAHGRDYFDDVWLVHQALGLGVEVGAARVFVTIVPVKEREIVVLGRPGASEEGIAAGVSHALGVLRSAGVVAHDLALYLPPLAADGSDWERFPPLARLVDRGDPGNRTCDIGSMELYAASVIASDPFVVAASLQPNVAR